MTGWHKNISHSQSFKMPENQMEHIKRSTTHETYQQCRSQESNEYFENQDKKKKEFEEYLWKSITEQVLKENEEKAKTFCAKQSQFETTYGISYQKDGFKVTELGETLDRELCAKYPLYGTVGMSIPVRRYECQKIKQAIHKPLDELFKKNTGFTN
ncbi:uncharacterized protein LOC126898295 isoform X2 [Daktulosphaira vitifoliae]|uniref:uncharacterized protein LOC126898295 isoform X2 n=1 Tax=Daktulosphaira vitifoliae TaxID=58002 RepID=UPI0021AAEECD|nr:uncharacterized protein LOC126898295 isoform X2 [Daktulosphaira vitifoliae]